MKRLLSYTFLMVFASLTVSSCIMDEFKDGSKPLQASLTIELEFPRSSDTRANQTLTPDSYEIGTAYENHIDGEKSIHLFIFDYDSGKYLGELQDKTVEIKSEIQKKLIRGTVSADLISQHVRLVFMANYDSRMNGRSLEPGKNQTYNEWANKVTFDYISLDNNSIHTQAKDGSYVPMSGEADMFIHEGTNSVAIEVTRALSKVRLKMESNSGFGIRKIIVTGGAGKSYCFKNFNGNAPTPDNLTVPQNQTWGGGRQFYMEDTNPGITPGNQFEFYIAEQVSSKMNISFELYDVKNPQNKKTQQGEIVFKYYPDGKEYPIERNYIYEFRIYKEPVVVDDTKLDITTTIQKWDVIDLNTNYE